MDGTLNDNIRKSIVDLLKKSKSPLTSYEIATHLNCSREFINNTLVSLSRSRKIHREYSWMQLKSNGHIRQIYIYHIDKNILISHAKRQAKLLSKDVEVKSDEISVNITHLRPMSTKDRINHLLDRDIDFKELARQEKIRKFQEMGRKHTKNI